MPQTREGAKKSVAAHHGITLEELDRRIEAGLKHCTKCKTWKPIGDFARDRSRGDGLKAACLQCGRVPVKVDRTGKTAYFKGSKHTPEAKAKMSAAHKGQPGNTTKRLTPEQCAHIRKRTIQTTPRGPQHPRWKGGPEASEMLNALRQTPEYADWRNAVFQRDGYTCRKCGATQDLQAHHLQGFAANPLLRHDVANGVTWCRNCHSVHHGRYLPKRGVRRYSDKP